MTKRNQPCPCGSNIKYKKCCGSPHPNGSRPSLRDEKQIHIEKQKDTSNITEHSKNNQNKPKSAQDHYSRGCTYIDRNMPEEAVECFQKALSLQPAAEVYYNLAVIQERLGNLADAIDSFQEALLLKPDFSEVNARLGNLFLKSDNFQEAINFYNKAISTGPRDSEIYNNLGIALKKMLLPEEAADNFRQALSLKSDFGEAYVNLGSVLCELDKPEEGITCYRKALSINSLLSEAHINLGLALIKEPGQEREAADCFLEALTSNPDSSIAIYNLGLIYNYNFKHDEARECFEKVLSLDPENYGALENLGSIYQDQRRDEEAAECFKKVLSKNPESAMALYGFGRACKDEGNFEEALNIFRKTVEFHPRYTNCHLAMTSLHKYCGDENHIVEMNNLYLNDTLNSGQKMYLAFGLAKAYEDFGEYKRSFSYLLEGNRLRREMLNYSEKEANAIFGHFKEVFNKSFVSNNTSQGVSNNNPIFILGMPRSGTSLVEQILASHSSVFGAGELKFVQEIISQACNSTELHEILHCIERNYEIAISELGNEYITKSHQLSASAQHITDKMPGNFLWLGLIHLALPNAKIIHCKRDPMDNCFSIYKNFFGDAIPYGYDQHELGHYYLLYKDLMAHWDVVLPPGTIYDISYEDVVSDQESETRKLLEYCELPWEDSCLSFHKTTRIVSTASAAQVRKPLYKDSIQLWKQYEKQLEPLQKIFGHVKDFV